MASNISPSDQRCRKSYPASSASPKSAGCHAKRLLLRADDHRMVGAYRCPPCAAVQTSSPRVASLSPDGFTNLRFAALANVPAGTPFFPAAYHGGAQTRLCPGDGGRRPGGAGFPGGRQLIPGARRVKRWLNHCECTPVVGANRRRLWSVTWAFASAGLIFRPRHSPTTPSPSEQRSNGWAYRVGPARLAGVRGLAGRSNRPGAFPQSWLQRVDAPRAGRFSAWRCAPLRGRWASRTCSSSQPCAAPGWIQFRCLAISPPTSSPASCWMSPCSPNGWTSR